MSPPNLLILKRLLRPSRCAQNTLEEIKKKCREEYVAAYVQMESYRSKGARLGVSFYASRSTMSGPKPLSSLQASASAGGGSLGLIEYGIR